MTAAAEILTIILALGSAFAAVAVAFLAGRLYQVRQRVDRTLEGAHAAPRRK